MLPPFELHDLKSFIVPSENGLFGFAELVPLSLHDNAWWQYSPVNPVSVQSQL